MQHADLHGIDADILDYGIDLVTQHCGRNRVDRAHAMVFCAVSAVIAVMP